MLCLKACQCFDLLYMLFLLFYSSLWIWYCYGVRHSFRQIPFSINVDYDKHFYVVDSLELKGKFVSHVSYLAMTYQPLWLLSSLFFNFSIQTINAWFYFALAPLKIVQEEIMRDRLHLVAHIRWQVWYLIW